MSKKIDKRVILIIASLLNCIGFTLVGPSILLNYPNSLLIMGIGQAVVGTMFGIMYIPALPASIESAIQRFPGKDREVNNMSAGLFQTFLGTGYLIAPLYGSTLN